MPSFRNLAGQSFGRLTAVERAGLSSPVKWRCVCQCGRERVVVAANLTSGNTTSCGCRWGDAKRKHGHRYASLAGRPGMSRTYRAWASMKARCDNPTQTSYRYYGGRGITYCDRWRNFPQFLADMGECPPGLTLERIDVDGHYAPGNCTWIPRAEQNRNKRNSRGQQSGG